MEGRRMAVERRLPPWLKVKMPGGPNYLKLRELLREGGLHTVCEEAHCPNIGDCWERKSATFMILGDICTRACSYCAVATGMPTGLDLQEPARLAEAVQRMGLKPVAHIAGGFAAWKEAGGTTVAKEKK